MLHVHRAERADRLADGLAQTLLAPLEDPFAADVVAVPTRGIERWLAQRLSTRLGARDGRHDGVCANIEFPFPGRLIGGAVATATGGDPDADPWLADHLSWRLLEIVDECLDEPWLGGLAAHLRSPDAEDPVRRFAVVRQVADLFDRYAVHRPELLRGWAAGDIDLAPQDSWQARLWLVARERIGLASPEQRVDVACARIRTQPELLELPPRLALFGLTRIPRTYMDVLAALAGARDVHLFVLHPSPALWHRVQVALDAGAPVIRRRVDPTARLPANGLLASWGRDARELQVVLAAGGDAVDHHYRLDAQPHSTLVQADVRADRQPPGPPLPGEPDSRAPLGAADRSLEVHACHGRARQVEVLRDAVLGAFADDETLEPREVIVMCPDIEAYAPLIGATFGAQADADRGEEADGRLPDLRVRLADRSLRQTNPLLGVIAALLELADQRATASQLLDLADRDPVRRRFGFDDDDLARMHDWVAAAGIRWGLNAQHRAPYKLDALAANTWRAGLDRILLGVAISDQQRCLIGGVLPLDDVASDEIDLAGRFAEYVDRVATALAALSAGGGIAALVAAIAAAADALTATSERESWQRSELARLLDDVLAQATHEGRVSAVALELGDLRALLADRLRGRPTRANFRTGHLTVCTLVPMRSVPHRVVCVLGLDADAFPRRQPRDGDDLTLVDPRVGDRDPRSEDRQMLLDALLAATERLIITYTGSDERTNLPRPPAVPVSELLDAVERTVRRSEGAARDQVLIRHPLQPFDPRNFTDGALVPGRRWSFDPVSLAGARALAGTRRDRGPFLEIPLPALATGVIELDNLVRFVGHPIRAFLRARLGISVRDALDQRGEVRDALPVELDGLGVWEVGQRLLEGVLAGASLDQCVQAELARGSLPPGRLAAPVLDRVCAVVTQLAEAARALADGSPRSLDVNLRLADGRLLAGTVPGVCAHTLRRISYARVRPRDRLAAWVRLLALTVARPELPWQSAVIGRSSPGSREGAVAIARIPALGEDAALRSEAALRHLGALIDLYDRGMREPLPVACETSAAYARASAGGADAQAAARSEWETTFGYDKEDSEPEHVLVHGGVLAFAQLLDEHPREDEQGREWAQWEATRFGRYARRLWDELLALEVLTTR